MKILHQILVVLGTANFLILLHPNPPRARVEHSLRPEVRLENSSGSSQTAAADLHRNFAPVFDRLREVMGYVGIRSSGDARPLRTRFPQEGKIPKLDLRSETLDGTDPRLIPFETDSWSLTSQKTSPTCVFPFQGSGIVSRSAPFSKIRPGAILPNMLAALSPVESQGWCETLGLSNEETSRVSVVTLPYATPMMHPLSMMENARQDYSNLEEPGELHPGFAEELPDAFKTQISLLTAIE